ncbi:expressed unknown protein [Seminavis robusta]|uniref:PNPLA domain-containing protein n=1 Tax=Seminavis robusta TaxID=568900 RepID=A0A9N8DHQ4_9STRA|nr:expressed unknown protein [Seminavis robusta]|eukprot:Sro133_g063110.1 n/a (647) ;mRNA; r:73212-75221
MKLQKFSFQPAWKCVVLLLLLLPFLAKGGMFRTRSHDPEEESSTPLNARQPFAFLVSGGGFRTTTIGMSMARALSQAFEEVGNKSWEDVTHVGCNSGGNWFLVPFVYNPSFFAEITQKTDKHFFFGLFTMGQDYKPLKHMVREMGQNYSQSASAEADLEEESETLKCHLGTSSFDMGDLISLGVKMLNVVDFGSAITDWRKYTDDILRPLVPNVDSLTYRAPRKALPHATLIQQLALQPDAWVDRPEGGTNNQRVYNPGAYSTYPYDPINQPFSHVSKSQSATGDVVDGFFSPLFGDSFVLQGVKDKNGAGSKRQVEVRFPPESRTLVGQVSSLSSAAMGALGSPTLMRIALGELIGSVKRCLPTLCTEELAALAPFLKGDLTAYEFVEILLREINTGRDVPEIVEDVLDCLPNGLEGVAPAMPVEPTHGSSEPPWTPTFRGIDGGYIENSVIHSTLGTFIQSCEVGDASLLCEEKTIDIVLVDDGFLHAFGTECFFDNSGIDNRCRPAGERMKRHVFWDIPSLQIFQERFPTNWTQYTKRRCWTPEYSTAAVQVQSIISYIQEKFKGSRWTSGTFNTVDNEAFGVKAGYKVRLLIFEINSPITLNPILVPPAEAKATFTGFYSKIVEEQADGMLPVITKWLKGEI